MGESLAIVLSVLLLKLHTVLAAENDLRTHTASRVTWPRGTFDHFRRLTTLILV